MMEINTDGNYRAVVFHKFESLMLNIYCIISSGAYFLLFHVFSLTSKLR